MDALATTKQKRPQGIAIPQQAKLGYLLKIREAYEDGRNMTLRTICQEFNVTLETASRWRKDAMLLIQKDDNGFNRSVLRHLQVGRIQVKIAQLEKELVIADGLKERMLVHRTIQGYYADLARITGLNSEVLEVQQIKPLQIIMPTIEAEVLDNPPPATPPPITLGIGAPGTVLPKPTPLI